MKRTIVILLVLVMLLPLAACGGKTMATPTAAPTDALIQEATPEPTRAPTPEPTAEPTPDPTPEPEPARKAIPLSIGDQIENENFIMTFDSLGIVPEYSIKTGQYSSIKLEAKTNYQYLLLRGHIENLSTKTFSDGAFSFRSTINDTFVKEGNDVSLIFERDKYFELDPYTDFDYCVYMEIPSKLAAQFEKAVISIGFNDDMSYVTTIWNGDGTKTVEVDQIYELISGIASSEASTEGTSGHEDANETGQGGTASATDAVVPNAWIKSYYVDNFNDPTDEWYIIHEQLISGTFSNSATTNSNLSVYVLIDAEKISFFLYEYDSNQVKNSYSTDETYSITMKDADGNKTDIMGRIYAGGDRIVIDDKYTDTVLEALSAEKGNVSFYLVSDKYSTTSYLFSVECANFAQEYQDAVNG